MSTNGYHAPSIRSIVLGIAVFLVLLVLFLFLSDFIKILGYPLLWLPEKIGLVRLPATSEIQSFELNTPDLTVNFPQAGRYVVYTGDADLLVTNDLLAEKNGDPWLQLEGPDGRVVTPKYVHRGLMPFDTPFAKGRPVMTFQIDAPGSYTAAHPRRQAQISVLPDTIGEQEGKIWLIYVVELGLIGYAVMVLVRRRQRQHEKRVKEIDGLKHIRGEEFWKAELEGKKRSRIR